MPPASIPPAASALFNAPRSTSVVVSRFFAALLKVATNKRMKMTISDAIKSVNDDAIWDACGPSPPLVPDLRPLVSGIVEPHTSVRSDRGGLPCWFWLNREFYGETGRSGKPAARMVNRRAARKVDT